MTFRLQRVQLRSPSGWSDKASQIAVITQNEITDVDNTVGSAWSTPKYDQAGNFFHAVLNSTSSASRESTTRLNQRPLRAARVLFKPVSPPGTPTWGTLTVDDWSDLTVDGWNDLGNVHGQSYTYDAWNRQVRAAADEVTQQENAYDGLGRRIIKKAYSSGSLSETRHYYYSAGWQVLEERLGTSPDSADAQRQYVWGLRYIDDLILRDRDTTGNGTLDERLYALQDANWNVTAVTNTGGNVQERYEYDAYGQPTFLTPAFGSRGSSSYDWETLYASYRWDADVELYHVRFRVYDPQYGVWMQRDPIGFAGGSANLYEYVGGAVVTFADPLGLQQNQASDFWDGPLSAQGLWIEKFKAKYGKLICDSAKRYNVPAELLAAVIANEQIDYNITERVGELAGFGQSLGPAQLHVRLAKKYNLFPYLQKQDQTIFIQGVHLHDVYIPAEQNFDIQLRNALNAPRTNIDAAAKLMAIFLDQLCDETAICRGQPKTGGLPAPSAEDLLSLIDAPVSVGMQARNQQLMDELCMRASGRSIVSAKVSGDLIATLAAAFNDDITVIWETDLNESNQNVIVHAHNAAALSNVFQGICPE